MRPSHQSRIKLHSFTTGTRQLERLTTSTKSTLPISEKAFKDSTTTPLQALETLFSLDIATIKYSSLSCLNSSDQFQDRKLRMPTMLLEEPTRLLEFLSRSIPCTPFTFLSWDLCTLFPTLFWCTHSSSKDITSPGSSDHSFLSGWDLPTSTTSSQSST